MTIPLEHGTIDLENRTVIRGESEHRLTRREAQLLQYLSRQPDGVASTDAIIQAVWGKASISALYKLVHQVRQKLESDPDRPRVLQTVRGKGLRLVGLPPRTEVMHNVPLALRTILGRDSELEQITAAVTQHRLVTLVGPGGVGKTSLARAVGRDGAEGVFERVWYVALGGLETREDILLAVGDAVGVRATSRGLAAAMDAHRQALLVLDEIERVVAATADIVSTWMTRAPELHILTTSRVPLHIPGERQVTVPPLDPEDSLQLLEAVNNELGTQADVAAVDLHALSGGLPLTVEILAHQLQDTPWEGLGQAPLLDLSNPDRSRSPRHDTLRSAIAWDWQALAPTSGATWARLSVFRVPFDEVAALKVAPDFHQARGALKRHGVIRRVGDRWIMQTAHRVWGEEQLTPDLRIQALQGHAEYYAALVNDLSPEALRPHLPDILAVLRHGPIAPMADMAAGMGLLCGHIPQDLAGQVLTAAIQRIGGQAPAALQADICAIIAATEIRQRNQESALEWNERAMRLADESTDRKALVGAAFNRATLSSWSYAEDCLPLWEQAQSLAKAAGDDGYLGRSMMHWALDAQVRQAASDIVVRESLYQGLDHLRSTQMPSTIAEGLACAAFVEHNMGKHAKAQQLIEEAMGVAKVPPVAVLEIRAMVADTVALQTDAWEDALKERQRLGADHGYIARTIASNLIDLGDAMGAVDVCNRFRASNESSLFTPVLVRARMELGLFDEARAAAATMFPLGEDPTMQEADRAVDVHRDLACIAMAQDDLEKAKTHIDQMQGLCDSLLEGLRASKVHDLAYLHGTLALLRNDRETAAGCFEEAARAPSPRTRAMALRGCALTSKGLPEVLEEISALATQHGGIADVTASAQQVQHLYEGKRCEPDGPTFNSRLFASIINGLVRT